MASSSAFKPFIDLCQSVKDPQLTAELFDLFFTPEEKEDFSNRYLIIQALLQQDKPQRQIAKDLHVSIAKITRGSNELKRISPALLAYLHHYLK